VNACFSPNLRNVFVQCTSFCNSKTYTETCKSMLKTKLHNVCPYGYTTQLTAPELVTCACCLFCPH